MITTQKVRLEPKTIASSGAVKRLLSAPADFRTFPYLGLSKVGFEDLSFGAKATNCDSHLKALAMVTTVR